MEEIDNPLTIPLDNTPDYTPGQYPLGNTRLDNTSGTLSPSQAYIPDITPPSYKTKLTK